MGWLGSDSNLALQRRTTSLRERFMFEDLFNTLLIGKNKNCKTNKTSRHPLGFKQWKICVCWTQLQSTLFTFCRLFQQHATAYPVLRANCPLLGDTWQESPESTSFRRDCLGVVIGVRLTVCLGDRHPIAHPPIQLKHREAQPLGRRVNPRRCLIYDCQTSILRLAIVGRLKHYIVQRQIVTC